MHHCFTQSGKSLIGKLREMLANLPYLILVFPLAPRWGADEQMIQVIVLAMPKPHYR
jgi:hypothetical protein